MNFKKWVKSIQTAGYNGARTVYGFSLSRFYTNCKNPKSVESFQSKRRQKCILWHKKIVKMYAILALIFLFHYSPTNSLPQKLDLATALKSKPCQVIEENSSLLKSCKFPFIYKNKAYYGCTTVDGVNDKPWCSTKVSYI